MSKHSPAGRIEIVCAAFERALRSGRVRIEDYLRGCGESGRAELVEVLLTLELNYRQKQGEQIQAADYSGRFPEQRQLIHELVWSNNVYRQTDDSGLLAGRYRLRRRLGGGSQGDVYLAYDILIDRQVAIKIPRETFDPEFLRLFRREAKLTVKFKHANVVTLYDYCEPAGKTPFLVMEYLSGQTLSDRHPGGQRPLTARQLRRFVAQICPALQTAHEEGIIHRDIKPGNIMLVDEGRRDERFVLLDLGLAKLADLLPSSKGTLADIYEGATAGTLIYMSPEQVNSADIDGRSDIYSFGTTLYQLISGELPFPPPETRKDWMSFVMKLCNEQPRPLPASMPRFEIPAAVHELIHQCLAKEPDDRPQSMLEVQQRFLKSFHSPTGLARRGRKAGTSPFTILNQWSVVIAVSILIGAITFWYFRPSPRTVRWSPPPGVESPADADWAEHFVQQSLLQFPDRVERVLDDGTRVPFVLVTPDPTLQTKEALHPFYIMRQKVTKRLFDKYIQHLTANPSASDSERGLLERPLGQNPSHDDVDNAAGPDQPIFGVTVEQAHFCAKWLGGGIGKLPSLAEWRLAAGYFERPQESGVNHDEPSGVSCFGCQDMTVGAEWTRSMKWDSSTYSSLAEVPLTLEQRRQLKEYGQWVYIVGNSSQSPEMRYVELWKQLDDPHAEDYLRSSPDLGFRVIMLLDDLVSSSR